MTSPEARADHKGAGAPAGSPWKTSTEGQPDRRPKVDAGGKPARDAAIDAGLDKRPSNEEAVTRAKRIERWPLERLRPHPRQDANFQPLTDRDLRQLADDMQTNGQTTPIEALPDGTIIAGHQRRRAAEILGWAKVRVWVRDDLAGDAFAAETRMIEDNRDRRQLDMLDQVRITLRLVELRRRRLPGGLSGHQQHETRDLIAQELGKSGRHIQRYLNVLKAVMEIQRLFSAGRLTLVLAGTVAGLPEGVQRQVAREIEAGGRPEEVVAPHLPEGDPAEIDPDKELELLRKACVRALDALRGREAEVHLPRFGVDLADYLKQWERTVTMIARIVDRIKSLKKDEAAHMRKLKRMASRFDRES